MKDFVKGVKDKIVETVFHNAPKDETSKQLEEARQEIKNLNIRKENLQSKWRLMTRRFDNAASLETELKKSEDERESLTREISRNEEKLRALYASKDERLKESEALRANLKKILDEKRATQGDTAHIKRHDRDVEQLKEELTEAKNREREIVANFEEIEMRAKFAGANMETLVLDATAAQRAIDNLTRTIENKKDSLDPLEKSKSTIDDVIAKLDELKTIQESTGVPLQEFKAAVEQLRQVREVIRKSEEEQGAIPRKIAELNVTGGKDRERSELVKREKSLATRIAELKEKEKKIVDEARKNKSALERAEKSSRELKHLMMSAGLSDLVSRVDATSSLDILKGDIERRKSGVANSIDSHTTEISQSQTTQAQKHTAITKMRDEINKLSKDAEQDKHDVERQREKLRKTKEQTTALRNNLEAKLREKGAAMSQGIDVVMESKRIEILESDAVNAINRIQTEVESMNRTENELLSTLGDEKERLAELDESKKFFTRSIEVITELEQLKSADKELALVKDVAAKYEADCRRLKDVEKQKNLLETKLTLVNETDVPAQVLESRLLEMREEHRQLEKELEPLRSEISFVVEKRDNMEMEISFAKESLKKATERKKSLERRLEFVTQESGSVRNIQEKLAVCENKLSTSQNNIAEIQTRLNFTIATEEVVKEKFQASQVNIEKIDKQIESIKSYLGEKEVQLPELRAKTAEHEQKISDKKGEKAEIETGQSSSTMNLKKNTIECDSLTEKIKNCDAPLSENREKERAIEAMMPSYNANLEKQTKLDAEIENSRKETDKTASRLNEFKTQIADIQDKKRALMEESLGTSAKHTEEVSVDKGKIATLRDERKAVREQLKALEAKIKELRTQGADKVEALRSERETLRKKIDQINEQMDAVKEGAPATVSTEGQGEAKNLASAIGELDIKVLSLTKSADKVTPEFEAQEKNLEDLTHAKEKLSLEIADQKSAIAPLDEIKRKIASLEQEKNSLRESLNAALSQKESLIKNSKNADAGTEAILKTIEDAERGLNQTRGAIEAIEINASGSREELDKAVRSRENTLSEFHRLKTEMDSIIDNIKTDRDMIEKEKSPAEETRKEVEETRKQLTEAMSILTGKTGSVDSLKLEIVSSGDEQQDITERIRSLDMELKTVTAAIDGIESNREPKAVRLKYLIWAQGTTKEKLESLKFRGHLEKMNAELKKLRDTRELYDEYNDLTKSKEELKERTGELKSYFEIETKLMTAEQARHEAMAQASENAETAEQQEAMIKRLEEKYRDCEEDRVQIKGMLDEVTHRFELAGKRWGKIEDLSRIEDSLELKIRNSRDQFGSLERIGDKANRLEKENAASKERVKSLEETCNTLHEEKRSLETALERTKSDFEGALTLVKKSRDEAKKFLYSEV